MILLLFIVLISLSGLCNCQDGSTLECGKSTKFSSYLDVALDMIAKAKHVYPTCRGQMGSKPVDCEEVLKSGRNKSGVYNVFPRNKIMDDKQLQVYCDMDTDGGGWLVFQRRGNFLRPKDYFNKDWASYKEGFGDVEKDFWLGNDNIYALSNQRVYSLRIDLKDMDGLKKFALYDVFWIDDESQKYTLHIKDFRGDAGNAMWEHDNNAFSTKDVENDHQPDQFCAGLYKGGWWYNACHKANLNGLYHRGKHGSFADGVNWETWKGYHESLDTTEMKFRPKNFRK